jgi:hypothetical protein
MVLNSVMVLIPTLCAFSLCLMTFYVNYFTDKTKNSYTAAVIAWKLWSVVYLMNHCQTLLFLGILWFIGR